MNRRPSRLVGAMLAGVVALSLAVTGCGSAGVSGGEGQTTALNTPTLPPPTLSVSDVKAIVKRRTPAITAAIRKFRTCDQAAGDSYVASPCLSKVAGEAAAVTALLGDLGSIELPPEFAATAKDLRTLSQAGAKVVLKCGKVNDQPCDQALARFRADEQSVIWDLDINP